MPSYGMIMIPPPSGGPPSNGCLKVPVSLDDVDEAVVPLSTTTSPSRNWSLNTSVIELPVRPTVTGTEICCAFEQDCDILLPTAGADGLVRHEQGVIDLIGDDRHRSRHPGQDDMHLHL